MAAAGLGVLPTRPQRRPAAARLGCHCWTAQLSSWYQATGEEAHQQLLLLYCVHMPHCGPQLPPCRTTVLPTFMPQCWPSFAISRKPVTCST